MGNKKKRPKIFTTQNPQKSDIVLYGDTLEEHIIKKHYYGLDEQDVINDIRSTVEEPDEIFCDKNMSEREVYAKEESHISDETIVVVEHSTEEKVGVITTSYPTTKKKWGRQTKNAKKKYSKNGN